MSKRSTVVVSDRFRGMVYAHLTMNLHSQVIPGTPLVLAIHGQPGTGKSFQLGEVLEELGVEARTLVSSDFEDQYAGEPARKIRRAYEECGAVSQGGARALVINDFDAAVGKWGDLVQTTSNRQHVLGELLDICDRPSGDTDDPVLRTPIFITANDLTKLYQPLMRSGRARLFYWEPDRGELIRIVSGIYADALDVSATEKIVDHLGSSRISDYSDLLNFYVHSQVMEMAKQKSSRADFDKLVAGKAAFGVRYEVRELIRCIDDWTAERRNVADFSQLPN